MTEANPEEEEPSPQEIAERIEKKQVDLQTAEVSLDTRTKKLEEKSEHQEVPKEEAAVKSSGITKKRPRDRHIAAGQRVKQQSRREESVNPEGSWSPPAGRCLAVQQWHGVEETYSGISGPKEILDRERK
jgi:hypothetical protein